MAMCAENCESENQIQNYKLAFTNRNINILIPRSRVHSQQQQHLMLVFVIYLQPMLIMTKMWQEKIWQRHPQTE